MRSTPEVSIIALFGCLLAASSPAAVLRVDKAQPVPPGVFVTIQAAVDASAPNDTISIANGRYDDLARYVFPSGDVAFAAVIVEVGPLAFIGDSRDGVRIGPSYYIGALGDGHSLGLGALLEAERVQLERVTLENTYYLLTTGASLILQDCLMTTPGHGFSLFAPDLVEVRDCRFVDIPQEIAIWSTYTPTRRIRRLTVENTSFENCGQGIGLLGVDQVEIVNCRFADCSTATQFDDDTVGTITNSWYENCAGSVRILDGSRCHLERVVSLGNISQGLYSDNGHFTGTHNYIEGGAGAAIAIWGTGTISMQNSTFLNGGEYTVSIGSRKSYFPVVPRFDLTNNYWGTADLGQIEDWILDGADYGHLIEVDFEPLLSESPVSTQASTVGRLKALFDRDKR